eukprot:CAMPEP_0184647712 /NCGR_PEP_ID=MMETSP0308-20130426/4698_1 /TAXON_ID=38269 /ORGANISM="Gloeochaete witrockiana, Strain SAG 46.84" /LENGTH=1149 /DNA_ID=CAMNT_0027078917 /DNA_START=101 /DNA_END=3553 /DNA_ORIENTATION=-
MAKLMQLTMLRALVLCVLCMAGIVHAKILQSAFLESQGGALYVDGSKLLVKAVSWGGLDRDYFTFEGAMHGVSAESVAHFLHDAGFNLAMLPVSVISAVHNPFGAHGPLNTFGQSALDHLHSQVSALAQNDILVVLSLTHPHPDDSLPASPQDTDVDASNMLRAALDVVLQHFCHSANVVGLSLPTTTDAPTARAGAGAEKGEAAELFVYAMEKCPRWLGFSANPVSLAPAPQDRIVHLVHLTPDQFESQLLEGQSIVHPVPVIAYTVAEDWDTSLHTAAHLNERAFKLVRHAQLHNLGLMFSALNTALYPLGGLMSDDWSRPQAEQLAMFDSFHASSLPLQLLEPPTTHDRQHLLGEGHSISRPHLRVPNRDSLWACLQDAWNLLQTNCPGIRFDRPSAPWWGPAATRTPRRPPPRFTNKVSPTKVVQKPTPKRATFTRVNAKVTPSRKVKVTATSKVKATAKVKFTPSRKVKVTATRKVKITPTRKVKVTATRKVKTTPTRKVKVTATIRSKGTPTPGFTVCGSGRMDSYISLSCDARPNYWITSIVKANWGVRLKEGCPDFQVPRGNCSKTVRFNGPVYQCMRKQRCTIHPTTVGLGNPCRGVDEWLYVTVLCSPMPPSRIRTPRRTPRKISIADTTDVGWKLQPGYLSSSDAVVSVNGSAAGSRLVLSMVGYAAPSDSQRFVFSRLATGQFMIRPAHALAMCVTVDYPSTNSLSIQPCCDLANQKFTLRASGSARLFALPRPNRPDLCFDLTNSPRYNAAPLGMQTCPASSISVATQQFLLSRAGSMAAGEPPVAPDSQCGAVYDVSVSAVQGATLSISCITPQFARSTFQKIISVSYIAEGDGPVCSANSADVAVAISSNLLLASSYQTPVQWAALRLSSDPCPGRLARLLISARCQAQLERAPTALTSSNGNSPFGVDAAVPMEGSPDSSSSSFSNVGLIAVIAGVSSLVAVVAVGVSAMLILRHFRNIDGSSFVPPPPPGSSPSVGKDRVTLEEEDITSSSPRSGSPPSAINPFPIPRTLSAPPPRLVVQSVRLPRTNSAPPARAQQVESNGTRTEAVEFTPRRSLDEWRPTTAPMIIQKAARVPIAASSNLMEVPQPMGLIREVSVELDALPPRRKSLLTAATFPPLSSFPPVESLTHIHL